MSNQTPLFGADYLDRKRRELIRLRETLRGIAERTQAEETEIRTESSLQAQEPEDDGQRLDRLELEGNLMRRDISGGWRGWSVRWKDRGGDLRTSPI